MPTAARPAAAARRASTRSAIATARWPRGATSSITARSRPRRPCRAYRLSGLAANVEVHVRMISKNYASGTTNWSAMSNELTFVTIDAGDGGGGDDPPDILPHATAGEASAMATSETVVVEAPTF